MWRIFLCLNCTKQLLQVIARVVWAPSARIDEYAEYLYREKVSRTDAFNDWRGETGVKEAEIN